LMEKPEKLISLPPGWEPLGRPVVGAAITAKNDVEAATTWLYAAGARSPNTFDAYRREATFLLIWLTEQGIALDGMKVEHALAYFELLADPPLHWVKTRRSDPALLPTQVLLGARSPKSIAYSQTVLKQMCQYLQKDAGYLRWNVFSLVGKPTTITETQPTRLLDLEGWRWLWDWLCALPCGKPAEAAHATRARWLFALLYHTGLRRQEAAQGRMGDFIRENGQWFLRVIGKGKRTRLVSINSTALHELIRYRRSLDLRDYPQPGEDLPLIPSVKSSKASRRNKPLTPRAIGLLVHGIAKQAQAQCPDGHIRSRIKQMSTHWMRHTNATHRLMFGASLETTQDELGHADPKTTRIYAKTTNKQRQADAEKLA
jgi:site-specific recombinase XerD